MYTSPEEAPSSGDVSNDPGNPDPNGDGGLEGDDPSDGPTGTGVMIDYVGAMIQQDLVEVEGFAFAANPADFAGSIVKFTGVLSGYSTAVGEDGSFSLVAPHPTQGIAWATLTDALGNVGDPVSLYVN